LAKARLRDSRLRCSGHSGIDSRRLALERPLRIDCGFRNLFFLGLLFGFQRPSRLLATAALCYRFPTTRQLPFQLRGCLLYFEAASLSSGRCRFVFSASPRFSLRFALRRSASSVEGPRNLLPLRLPCQPTSSTPSFPRSPFVACATPLLQREAASTTASSGVNSRR
jgi:hypothetical protein